MINGNTQRIDVYYHTIAVEVRNSHFLLFAEWNYRNIMNFSSHVSKSLSFLQARDPSLLTANIPLSRKKVKPPLTFENLDESSEESGDNVKVYLRIKNAENISDVYKIERNVIHCHIPATSTGSNSMKDVDTVIKRYEFSSIFDRESTQNELFCYVVKPKVLKFINGENFTLMSYGASGSGKTYTMVGTISQPGLIPRTLEYMFNTLPKLSEVPLVKPTSSGDVQILNETCGQEEVNVRNDLLKLACFTIGEHTKTYEKMQHRLSMEPAGIMDEVGDVTLGVWVSFAEIYNEHIYDLLTPKCDLKATARPKLQLAACGGNTYIKNLTNVSVSSGIQAYQILQYGLHNLNYAATSINSHSSRSHCIFTIKIAQLVNDTNVSRFNYFHFCDLAGSERSKKTMNVGERLVESNNINTSLLVLGRCISCIRESQKKNVNKLVPFRDSKLTMLFQRALSGYETISMIVNMNPSFDMLEETQHVLNFSAIAKDITVKLLPITPKRKAKLSPYLASKADLCNDRLEQLANNEEEEDEESEMSSLQDVMHKLYNELEFVNRYQYQREQEIREEMTEAYTAIINDIKERHQQQMRKEEAKHKEQLQMLRSVCENKNLDDEIIILNSSSDEEEEEDYSKKETIIPEIEECKIRGLENEIAEKDKIIDNLRQTIEEARSDYRELEKIYEEKVNNLTVENLALADRNLELSTELEEYIKIVRCENEAIFS